MSMRELSLSMEERNITMGVRMNIVFYCILYCTLIVYLFIYLLVRREGVDRQR